MCVLLFEWQHTHGVGITMHRSLCLCVHPVIVDGGPPFSLLLPRSPRQVLYSEIVHGQQWLLTIRQASCSFAFYSIRNLTLVTYLWLDAVPVGSQVDASVQYGVQRQPVEVTIDLGAAAERLDVHVSHYRQNRLVLQQRR